MKELRMRASPGCAFHYDFASLAPIKTKMNMSLLLLLIAACVTVNAGDIDKDYKVNPLAASVLASAFSSPFGFGDEPIVAEPVLSSPVARVALGQVNVDKKKSTSLGRDSVKARRARNQRKTKGKKREAIAPPYEFSW
jgi:hypothetical protein